MEQHPVPRNITGFQFHLIGDMTLKQFGELLAGFIVAYLIIKFPLPSLISWPAAIIFALGGVAFAFVPVQERPLDRWLAAYLKSIYSPTQFLWQKQNHPPDILVQVSQTPKQTAATSKHLPKMKESQDKLKAYLATLPKHPHETIDTYEQRQLAQTMALFATPATPADKPGARVQTIASAFPHPVQPLNNLPQLELPQKQASAITQAMALKSAMAQMKLNQAHTALTSSTPQPGPQPQPVQPATPVPNPPSNSSNPQYLQMEEEMAKIAQEKDRLAQELAMLKRTMVNPQAQTSTAAPAQNPSPNVKIIRPEDAPRAGLPTIPQVPNMISGIIKDSQGNLLSNIIITVKDKNGIPQRALKSNRLGQFAASTPLANETYTVEVDDAQKKFTFDTITMTLTGQLTTPLEILAKSEREVHRERMMKEVFGTS